MEEEEEEPHASSRTQVSSAGILIVAYSSPTLSLPPTPCAPEPFVRDVCAEWVRHALYVSSKYRRDSGSAVPACRLLCIAVLILADNDCLCTLIQSRYGRI